MIGLTFPRLWFLDLISLIFSGLSKRTTSERLQEAFSQFGEVVHGLYFFFKFFNLLPLWITNCSFFLFAARVVTDRVSGYSKGFGFVRYGTLEDAAKGIEGMDGKVCWNKSLFIFSCKRCKAFYVADSYSGWYSGELCCWIC